MKYSRVWLLLLFVIFVGIFLLLNDSKSEKTKTTMSVPTDLKSFSTQQIAVVARVVDGDTVKVLIQSKEDTVRLIGIDAPETVDPKKPVQCYDRETSDKAKEVLTGKSIVLESDTTQSNRDEYGRLLRYVFLQD